MSDVTEWTDDDEAALSAWLEGRPDVIQEMVRSHPPRKLYVMRSTGQRVTLLSYNEDRTVQVAVRQGWNPERLLIVDRNVFGVSIDDLIECDLPPKGTQ